MLIREALISDLDGLTACARKFFEYADYEGQGLPFDEKSFREMTRTYIEHDRGVVFVLLDKDRVVGAIGGQVMPWSFNHSIKIALELFYWVDENCRGINSFKLLREYEKRLKEKGAKKSVMIAINTNLQDRIEKLYLYCGYTGFEKYFIKDIKE